MGWLARQDEFYVGYVAGSIVTAFLIITWIALR